MSNPIQVTAEMVSAQKQENKFRRLCSQDSPDAFRKTLEAMGLKVESEHPGVLRTGHPVVTFAVRIDGALWLFRDDGPRDDDKVRRGVQPVDRFCAVKG